jgi:anti-sigma factor RsiW
MEELLARYLDGELTEDEAGALIRAAEDDPAVAAQLRDYETMLEASEGLSRPTVPVGFTARVMDRIEPRQAGAPPRFATLWPAAAALALGLALGYLFAPQDLTHLERAQAGPPPAVVFSTVSPASVQPRVHNFQAVRLTYTPTRSGIDRVSVAGSFNDWDPTSAPMVRDGDVWTLLLILPAGTYEYMVIEDGERWVTDPSAPRTRDDGFGGTNGLLELRS